VDEKLFVVAEAVEGVKDGEVFCLVNVESGRKNDAVSNAARKDFTGDRVAFDTAGGGSGREGKEIEEEKEVKRRTEVRGVGS
jgi:hypothetical protein